jgi:phosphoacetylglucosamine mutase
MLLTMIDWARVQSTSIATPRTPNLVYAYGTAGFRYNSDTLDAVCLRMGMLAAVRSRCFPSLTNSCHAVGAMLTASHNPECDNGLKLVDPSGSMLDQDWEPIAARLANAEEVNFASVLTSIVQEQKINLSLQANVVVGRDTRPSSSRLHELFVRGAQSLGAHVTDLGVVTTPQLHYVVRELFQGNTSAASVQGYYDTLSTEFRQLMGNRTASRVLIDCANGVGRFSVAMFAASLHDVIAIETINTEQEGLNHNVGAEFVQSKRKAPLGFDEVKYGGVKAASIDGDADRLVYFFFDDAGYDYSKQQQQQI